MSRLPYNPLVIPPPLAIPPRGDRHFDISSGNGWLYSPLRALLFSLCNRPLSGCSPVIPPQALVFGTTPSRSKHGPLLATDIGASPPGPEFLHIGYQGTGVVHHAQLLF